MLTPMLVQYVVGLCCLRSNPDAVDVVLGDLVSDAASKKRRDVDVTVTIRKGNGALSAFKAYEVKREGGPLDVIATEQLCVKLADMPDVTHRAIVSTSAFTDGAINKAKAHRVEPYLMKPWTETIASKFPDFPKTGTPEGFFSPVESTLLFWIDERLQYVVPAAKTPSFPLDGETGLFTARGKPHKKFRRLKDLSRDLLMRSTSVLYPLEPAQTLLRTFPCPPTPCVGGFEVGPAWPHTHTLQITADKVFITLEGELHAIDSVTINGRLQWRKKKRIPEFYIMERIPDGEIFAGAAVAEFGSEDGKMFAFIFPPSGRNRTDGSRRARSHRDCFVAPLLAKTATYVVIASEAKQSRCPLPGTKCQVFTTRSRTLGVHIFQLVVRIRRLLPWRLPPRLLRFARNDA